MYATYFFGQVFSHTSILNFLRKLLFIENLSYKISIIPKYFCFIQNKLFYLALFFISHHNPKFVKCLSNVENHFSKQN